MSILLAILLSLTSVLLLTVAGIFIWYHFKWLKQPQLFLVSVPYKYVPLKFDAKESKDLPELFNGKWATKNDLETALHDGMYVDQAGYLADVTQIDPNCGGNPNALFTDVSLGVERLAYACGRGYFIVGTKPSESNAALSGTHFSVQPWNQTTGQWNRYELSTFSELWKALTGR